MKVTFRVDASLKIGTGHVARCLTLAKALQKFGHDCRFVCRNLEGHLGQSIKNEGFELALLSAPTSTFYTYENDPVHAYWAEVPWEIDAQQTAFVSVKSDWLVIDHYSFDARWQNAVREVAPRIAVIDDLADRTHVADLLLDQNLGRKASDYNDQQQTSGERLIGPRYALLRPEFCKTRDDALKRRATRGYTLKNVLVSMGGVDLENATSSVLTVLANHPDIKATIVMGKQNPALEIVKAQAAKLTIPAVVEIQVDNMAELICKADLGVGAAGGSAWERCTLGMPALIAVLAKNQTQGAAALSDCGAAINLGSHQSSQFATKLNMALEYSKIPKNLCALSESAASITDGRGVSRVVEALENPLTVRESKIMDADDIWGWRQALPATHFRKNTTVSFNEHLTWFSNALTDPNCHLYSVGEPSIAHLRLDLNKTGRAAVSILLAPHVRGKGFGQRCLSLLAQKASENGIIILTAEVHVKNIKSLKVFRNLGYEETAPKNDFCNFELKIW